MNRESKRVFVGIFADDLLQSDVSSWVHEHDTIPVRWLAPHNLHVTLLPPWYTDEEGIERTIGLLRNISCEPFEMGFEHVRYGPNIRDPRLIWAEGNAPKGLLKLKQDIDRVFGKQIEPKPYLLHMTLARFRPESFSSFPIKKLDERVSWNQVVRYFCLIESRLSRAGAEYEPVGCFDLSSEAD